MSMDDAQFDPIDIRALNEHAIKSGHLRMKVCDLAEAYVAALAPEYQDAVIAVIVP
jgi:hypothetical protein